jgi:transposase
MDINNIFLFKNDSAFIIDLRQKNYNSLISKIDDFNELKPNDEEISVLKKNINKIIFNEDSIDEDNEIGILQEYKEAFCKFIPGIQEHNKKAKIILKIILDFKKKESISIKKITQKYKKITGEKISKSTIYKIIRNKLNYRYLKTVPKTNKLNTKSSKIRKFIFIKTFIRALSLGLNIIFIDESNFQLQNNHLRVWRKKDELPLFNCVQRGRRNIIMAISQQDLLLYTIDKGTNDNIKFLDFMKDLIKVLEERDINNPLIIMDNCSIHLTKDLIDFYKENKLKILTIVPYASELNAIEIFFNYIKQKIYKKTFGSLEKLIEFVEKILKEDGLNIIIQKIFKKTTNIYLQYIDNNNGINLNEL